MRWMKIWAVAGIVGGAAVARDVQIVATEFGGTTPIEGVSVLWDGGKAEHRAVTDASGIATFSPADDEARHVMVRLTKPGRVGVADYWNAEKPGDPVPARWTFNLEPATRIGGRVIDDDGHGIAGAHVVVHARKNYKPLTQHVKLQEGEALTDDAGHWTLDGVPAECEAIEIAAWHHQYLPADGYYLDPPFKPQEKLRDGSATFTLHPGTKLTGTVRDAAGRPVAGAKVFYNANRRVSNGFAPVTTADDGTFVLGIAPGTTASLVAEHDGFAPAHQAVSIGRQPQSTELVLRPPHVLSGRVLDGSGQGVAGARVWIHDWHGSDTLDRDLKTDAAGTFEWKEAPADAVKADLMVEGYVGMRDVELKAGENNELRVIAPTHVSVTVQDAKSGKPVKNVRVRQAVVWHPGERAVWQSADFSRAVTPTESGFTHNIEDPMAGCILRVETADHYPADTPTFVPDGRPQQFTLKLDPADPLAGQLVLPDGTPPGKGEVYLATDYLSIENGNQVRFPQVHVPVSADGRFSLPPTRERGHVIVVTDKGAGRWEPGQWETLKRFELQPWAQVRGRVMVGDKPLADASLSGSQFVDKTSTPPIARWTYDVHTDADGRFTLDHVWPGRVLLSQWVPNHSPRRQWGLVVGSFDAKPGQAADVHMGGTGTPVVGRLEMARVDKPWMLRVAGVKASADADGASFSPRVADDGGLRIEDLPAGDYAMTIALHEWPPEDSCGWGRVLGEYKKTFTVAPVAGGGLAPAPLDLGTIPSAVRPTQTLRVGDTAPDFELNTLDGQSVRLSDFKGKLVLLDFWAGWCAPCVAELPRMKALRDAHRDDKRLVLLGMNEDEEPGSLRAYVTTQHFDWPHALLGATSEIAKTYGATAIPATVLIGPDGKVIARDERGDTLRACVDAALQAMR